MLVPVLELLDVLEKVGVRWSWQPKVRHLDSDLLGYPGLVQLGVVGQVLDRLSPHTLVVELVDHSAETSVGGVVWLDLVQGISLDGDPRQDRHVVLDLGCEVGWSEPVDGIRYVHCKRCGALGCRYLRYFQLLTWHHRSSRAFHDLLGCCAHGGERVLADGDGEGLQYQRES